MRLGVIGGTFDPIHLGHLVAAQEAQVLLDLDLVLFSPTGDSWQKQGSSSPEDRLSMVELAIASNELFQTCKLDVGREGPTYTFDTLRELREQYPEDDLFFILGTDAYAGMASWKYFDELANLATFVVVARTGAKNVEPHSGFKTEFLQIPNFEISSTYLRERASKGLPLKYLVTEGVEHYITRRSLYKEAN
jgi:nicotinate-nucleotide adenylyltransferase